MNYCDSCKANKVCDHNKYGFENCNNFIPTADVAEVKRGEWKKCVREEFYETRFVRGWYKPLICSECGYKRPPLDNKEYPICQNCGAKMDGGGNNT